MSRREPDYNVSALDKTDERKGHVGKGWLNEDGSIAVVLSPFVVLQGGKDRLITLFPIKKKENNNEHQ